MNTNNVSFGKIVKVSAPLNVAENIAARANNSGTSRLDAQIKNIINDTRQGRAYAYAFPDTYCTNPTENESYIFSGAEGIKYFKSFDSAWNGMDHAYS